MSRVTRQQRFSRDHTCPICGGHDGQARGKAIRCYGFLSDDGHYAHCTRAELAGSLMINPDSGAYAHRLVGSCDCGVQHGMTTARVSAPGSSGRVLRDADFERCHWPYPCDYADETGAVLYRVARWEREGGKTYSMHHQVPGGWASGRGGDRRVLYGLTEVLAAVKRGDTIHVVEGEKKAHALRSLGLVATCNCGGAGKFTRENAECLRGAARVVVWADNDAPGRTHAQEVITLLRGAGITDVLRPEIPGLENGQGLDDWFQQAP